MPDINRIKRGEEKIMTDTNTMINIETLGEIVIARFTNQYWAPGTWTSGDMPRCEARATRHQDGCLILHPDDADDKPHALVTLDGPSARICGWAFGREGKVPQYWRENVRAPAFFVPQDKLRSTDDLVGYLDHGTVST